MTPVQLANLATLATYLEAHVPPPEFGMQAFMKVTNDHNNLYDFVPDNTEAYHQCGTSACAVGHGPLALPDSLIDETETWNNYSKRVFGCNAWSSGASADRFYWMFGGDWSDIDDTPTGAAARIRYFLDKPLRRKFMDPANYYRGDDLSEYLDMVEPFLKQKQTA